jgi:hypothetical protein
VKGNAGMTAKATAQLAALVLNVMSLKIAQYEEVTDDGRTAGDVLTYASQLLTDADGSNDELAKDITERLNTQDTIVAGVVPEGGILYRDVASVPGRLRLIGAHPNPARSSTTIRFALPASEHVRIRIHDVAGRTVRELVDRSFPAGVHAVVWDGRSATGAEVAPGVYFQAFRAGEYVETRKVLWIQ